LKGFNNSFHFIILTFFINVISDDIINNNLNLTIYILFVLLKLVTVLDVIMIVVYSTLGFAMVLWTVRTDQMKGIAAIVLLINFFVAIKFALTEAIYVTEEEIVQMVETKDNVGD
jgi:hypothetical protein